MGTRVNQLYHDLLQKARGWDYHPALKKLEELQWSPPAQVAEYRLQRLRRLLAHCCENVPFYKEQFRRVGMSPFDIRSENHIDRLPIVTKRTLREDYDRFFATDHSRRFDTWVSSGSTGEPFPFRLDKRSIAANTFAALARGRRWWGMDFGVREGMIWSGIRDVSGTRSGAFSALRRRLSWRLKNIIVINVYDLNSDAIQRAYKRFLDFQPVLIRAISSGLFRFCEGLENQGLDGQKLGVRGAIYTGESLPPAQRALVERVLGCKAISEYGCTELGVIAFECPNGGMHISHENLFVEYLADGRRAMPGEPAELIVTNLNDYAAPLVRYAVGDVVVPTDRACPCGRSLPLISSVAGRTHDTIMTPEGAPIHGLYFTHIFDRLPNVHQFRIIQEKLDRIRIELKSANGMPESDRRFIRGSVGRIMGEGVAIEVEQVAELPLSPGGKVQWIVSKARPRPQS
jgi:phenylacetate-CoA ligase